MCCLTPSCIEDDPRAQKKPTTKGSPKYEKTTQGLESQGLKGKSQTTYRLLEWCMAIPSQNIGPKRKQSPMKT